ncbi:unnamed protein product [Alopecurus aequalis]
MARDKPGRSTPASLVLRIATVALSVASTVMMASASASAAVSPTAPASTTVSYSDYSSLREEEGKAAKSLAQLVDTAAQVLLYSSSALSFAVDDFGSCGRRLTGRGVCDTAGVFCQRVHVSGAISIAAAVALSVSLYIKDVPVSVSLEHKSGPGCARGCHCHH